MPVRTIRLPGKHRVWVVCTLASLLVMFNVARPIQTIYQYSANVVASENRFISLEHAEHAKGSPFVQLRPIADLLLERPYQASVSATIPNLNVRAVDVYHGTRLTSEQLSKNLVEGSESGRTKTIEEEQSRNARWNRWRIRVLEHQIEQASLGQSAIDVDETSAREGEMASPYRLVSVPQKLSSRSDVISTLEAELAERQQLDKFQDFIFKQRAAAGQGIISLSTPWQIRMAIQNVNGWSLLACLSISLTIAFCHCYAGSIAIWLNCGIRRFNGFDNVMRRMRIEVLCTVGKNTEEAQDSMPLTSSRIILIQYLTCLVSEWVILLAMAISCARFVFDPLWRDLLLYSPLAAINNLVCLF